MKVIQIGTGLTGRHALRAIGVRPDLQLVGLWVFSPEKQGLSVAELMDDGTAFAPEIRTTCDMQELIERQADCVLFMPADPTISSPLEPGSHGAKLFDLLCRFLASGKNVVSTALISLVNPEAAGPGIQARLQEACDAGGTSFFATGISPGFIADALLLTLSSLSQTVENVRCTQLLDFRHYNDPRTLAAYGFGARPEAGISDRYGAGRERYVRGYGPSVHLVGKALGLALAPLEFATDVALTPFEIDFPGGRIEAGCIAAHRSRISARAETGQSISFERIVRMHRDVAPEWVPLPPDRQWATRVEIEGRPAIDNWLTLGSKDRDGTTEACLATAARAVNAVLPVCAARPGPKTLLDLPPVHGFAS